MSTTQPPKSTPPNSNSNSNPTSQTRTHTARPPAPALFIAPSQNASSVSLRPPATAGPGATSTRIPLLRQRSATRGEGDSTPNIGVFSGGDKSGTAGRSGPSSSFLSPNVAVSASYSSKSPEKGSPLGVELSREPSRTEEPVSAATPSPAADSREKTIAQWRTMQNTLNDIALTTSAKAPTTGQAVNQETGGLKENFNRIFPPEHARALEDLRRAQIALAQAWARSEAEDEVVEDIDEREMERRADGSRVRTLIDAEDRTMDMVDQYIGSARHHDQKNTSPKADLNSDKARASEVAQEKGTKTMLEEETERDIMLARKRRQMNDRYFERVNKGVVDVVAKLEDVANRMRAVEMESKEIWGEDQGHANDKQRRTSTSARSA